MKTPTLISRDLKLKNNKITDFSLRNSININKIITKSSNEIIKIYRNNTIDKIVVKSNSLSKEKHSAKDNNLMKENIK
jgi:hypothetical protein